MNKEKKETILNWLRAKEDSDSLTIEEREVFASIKELLHTKKYGLVFEEKEEDIVKLTNESILTLTAKNSVIFDKTKSLNYLIEGDNYQSLKLLLKTRRNRIDVIYIDPPYNTGNKTEDGGFIYNDSFVDNEDTFKHSKWLSFMRKRLDIAKKLLTDTGVIFISIDDNEYANLKLLSDEVFGENNFVANICRPTTPHRNGQEKFISVNHDYVLIYAKNKNVLKEFSRIIPKDQGKNKEIVKDELGRRWYKNDTAAILAGTGQGYQKSMDYDITIDGHVYSPINSKGERWRWLWSKERFEKAIELKIIKANPETNKVRRIMYLDYTFNENNELVKNDNSWMRLLSMEPMAFERWTKGTDELSKIDQSLKFSYPKPSQLVFDLVKLIDNKNAIILDFFAGSGTTGHAVAKLNAEDGGNRTYILCTNNENNICEDVTFKRLNNIQEELPHNLIYNKVESINKEEFINSYYSREYLKQLDDSCYQLAQLELGKLIDNEDILFATSQEEFNSFSEEKLLNAKVIFVAENNIEVYECAVYDNIKNKLIVISDKYYSKELTEVGYLW
ncbi:site-specific DNA-methyltransferase [Mycoplasma sp. Z463D]